MDSKQTPGHTDSSKPEFNRPQRRIMAKRQNNTNPAAGTNLTQNRSQTDAASMSANRMKSSFSDNSKTGNAAFQKPSVTSGSRVDKMQKSLQKQQSDHHQNIESFVIPNQTQENRSKTSEDSSNEKAQRVHNKLPSLKKRRDASKKDGKSKSKNTGNNQAGSKRNPIAALRNYMAHWSEYSTKKKALSILIAAVALFLVIFLLFSIYELITTPKLNMDNFSYIQGTQILDKNGNAYQNFETAEYREIVTIDQIPEHVKNAFIDIEDQRFYSHSGVDFKGLTRAVLSMIFSGSLNGPGGSTITQQLIKQTHLSSEKTLDRKYHEIILALELEGKYSKDQILEAYLNQINLSQAWGIQAAAKTYFNTDVGNLTIAQAAMLAAMPKSPYYFDPYVYDDNGNIVKEADGRCKLSEDNKERAIIVLDKMLELKHISQEERDQAVAQIEANNVGLTYVPHSNTYSYFTEALYEELINDLVEQKKMTQTEASEYLMNEGLIVYSTVDPEVQSAMEEAAADDDLFPSQSGSAAQASAALSADKGETINYTPEVAMTVIDNRTDAVAGMVGGRNKDSNLTLNRATRRFQPGSSTKPLTTYGPGLDTGAITLGTVFDDAPINYYGWQPKNASGGYSGPLTIRQGLVRSLNTMAAQACITTGVETCASYAEKLGLYINRENEADVNPAALALGGYSEGQSTLNMASAFSTFVNKGVHKSYSYYTKVTDRKGNTILEEKPTETQVFSEQTAYLITDVLQQAIRGGTTNLYCCQPIAGKTGTTDDERHAWICGYTPYYTMSVWYGYDDNYVETSQGSFILNINVDGGSKPGPASMLQAVMNAINENKEDASFPDRPDGITTATIDTISGKLATSLSSAAGHTYTEMFIEGTVPTESDDAHYSATICSDSGLLARSDCPNKKDEVFYRMPSLFPNGMTGTSSSSKLAPTETCTMSHTSLITPSTNNIIQNILNGGTEQTNPQP